MKINKGKIRLYSGVTLMVLALLTHMGLNVNENTKTKEAALNDFKKIEVAREPEESDDKYKRKGR